ncbi:unnamed protein product [Heligmosomoides polygyrus]|uniref:C2H2-type domain-containing protein n=1 Tax=Heligmosomoides polygyrus TaxID=6339 RepID=A0A183GVI8_HELPZ|nr:unnamed protein product [Heligmosomoides polygyrus]
MRLHILVITCQPATSTTYFLLSLKGVAVFVTYARPFHDYFYAKNNCFRYICPRCGSGFDLSEPYKIHLRQHDGLQPYSCSVCSKKFVSRAVCRRHRAGHNKTS